MKLGPPTEKFDYELWGRTFRTIPSFSEFLFSSLTRVEISYEFLANSPSHFSPYRW